MRKLFALVLLLSACSSSYSEVRTVTYEKSPAPHTVRFRTGAIGEFAMPLSALEDARITSVGGLVFLFSNKANFSVDTITDTQTGHPGVDMRTWPEYLFGVTNKGSEPKAFIDDLTKSKEVIINEQVKPFEVRKFKTREGIGYWAVGKERSAIVLTSNTVQEQVAVIFTTDMSEKEIQNIIINGVL